MTKLEEEDIKKVAELNYRWDCLSNKTILISGGTGFIGQFLINVIKYRNKYFNNNIKVVSCSRHGLPNEANIEYVEHDVTKPFKIDRKIDYIIHLASNTHPKQYAVDPVGTIITYLYGTYNLLQLAVSQKTSRFLLASSVEVYGEGNNIPLSEAYSGYIDCNTARAGYNETKRVSESLSQSFISQYGIDCVIARLARCFGADRKEDSKAMAQFMNCAVRGEDIVLKSKGDQRFSFCYIADAVSGLLKILLEGKCGGAYNIAGDDEGLTLGNYAEYIASLAEKKVVYNIENNESVSKASYAVLDCTKLKDIGWNPIYSVRDALNRTYKILSERK